MFQLAIVFIVQKSAMNRFFATHEILNISESTILKYNYVLWFIRTHYKIAKSISTTLISNSYVSKYVWFIGLLIKIYKFRKIFIILRNDWYDSNYSSTLIFPKKKEKDKDSKQRIRIRIIDLVCYTTYVVCVNFIHKWRGLQFKVDS